MDATNNSINKHYDAYYVKNNPDGLKKVPNCIGAIGVTIDENVSGATHKCLWAFNKISTAIQGFGSTDSNTLDRLTLILMSITASLSMPSLLPVAPTPSQTL